MWEPMKRKPLLIILDDKRLRYRTFQLRVGRPTLTLSWTINDFAFAVDLCGDLCTYRVSKAGRGIMLLSSKLPSDTLASLSDTGETAHE